MLALNFGRGEHDAAKRHGDVARAMAALLRQLNRLNVALVSRGQLSLQLLVWRGCTHSDLWV